jgi:hypothetical protein
MPAFTKVGLDALLTSENCVQPAIHAMGEGYDVYVVITGAQPITWLGMAGELQRDWARTERLGEVAQILFDHAGASGTAWSASSAALSRSSPTGLAVTRDQGHRP